MSRALLSMRPAMLVSAIVFAAGCTGDAIDAGAAANVAPAASIASAAPPPATSPEPPAGPDAFDDVTPPDASTLRVLRESDAGLPVIAIAVAGERYEVELAATNASRSRGMGGRDRFPAGTGMLFVHVDDMYRNYWMKDCLVGMDIAFLDRQGRIVAMHRMPAEPPRADGERAAVYESRLKRYPSRRHARYALEVPYGDLKRLGLRVGQDLPLPRAALDDLAARESLGPGR